MKKYQELLKQISKYFGVALVGLFFDFFTLIFLREVVVVHYLLAAMGGFIIGLLVVYFLSNKLVFANPKIKSPTMQFVLFAIIGLVGLGILSVLMWLFTDIIGINYIISKVFSTVFVYCWNFFARRALYHN